MTRFEPLTNATTGDSVLGVVPRKRFVRGGFYPQTRPFSSVNSAAFLVGWRTCWPGRNGPTRCRRSPLLVTHMLCGAAARSCLYKIVLEEENGA
jgi:hypothetical protein